MFPANNSDLGSSENLVVGKTMLIIEFSPCPCNQALGCKIIESGKFCFIKIKHELNLWFFSKPVTAAYFAGLFSTKFENFW